MLLYVKSVQPFKSIYIEVYEACILIEKHQLSLVYLKKFFSLNGQNILLCSYHKFYWPKKLKSLFKSDDGQISETQSIKSSF